MPMKPEREYRNIQVAALELRDGDSGEMMVQGYATTFNQPYELYRNDEGVLMEQIDPGAFAETDMADVIMQYDHAGRVFARKRNGTLALEPDAHGLLITANLGGTTLGRQLYEEIRGGYTDRMSFGFTVGGQTRKATKNADGSVTVLRTITKIRKLFDVSAVSLPANEATEITARSLGDGLIAEAAEELRSAAPENPDTEVENVTTETRAEDLPETRDADEEQELPAEAEAAEEEAEEQAETEETKAEDDPDEEAAEAAEEAAEAEEEAEEDEADAEEARANLEAMERRNAVAAGHGTIIEEHDNKEDKRMSIEEIRSSVEYVDAFAKYLRSGDDRECRTLLKTENASGKVPVPVLVDEIIRTAWDNEELLAGVRKTAFRGNLKVAFEKAGDNAYVHTEGTSAPTEEALELGIVTMTPANIKKWIHITDEDVTMGGEAFVRYIYEELAYQIMKKLANLVVADIVALNTSNQATSVGAARITEAPGLTTIANAFANLSDEASDPVIIMNKLTWANFQAAYAAGNFAVDPFMGLKVLFNNSLPAYDTATGGTDDYAIVGDLKGAQLNYPEGEGVVIKWDDLSEAEADLVKVVGRQYVAHAVTAPFRFTRIKKPSAGT